MRNGRWGVKEGFRPNIFPLHASGNSYILSRMAVSLMTTTYFEKSYPDLWIEDAYLTGVLREGNNTNIYLNVPKT